MREYPMGWKRCKNSDEADEWIKEQEEKKDRVITMSSSMATWDGSGNYIASVRGYKIGKYLFGLRILK